MLRIVGVQRSEDPGEEFVLLKNQGVLKLHLRGHMVAAEAAFGPGSAHRELISVFSQDEVIPPGAYVMLVTGEGQDSWGRSGDGSPVYYAFWNRKYSAWDQETGPIHVLGVLHSKPGGISWAAAAR
jgi:hypothetical protein